MLRGMYIAPHLHIQLWCGPALRLQKYLMAALVSKAYNLVLNRRAVAGTFTVYPPTANTVINNVSTGKLEGQFSLGYEHNEMQA